jgi:hypothetical protein
MKLIQLALTGSLVLAPAVIFSQAPAAPVTAPPATSSPATANKTPTPGKNDWNINQRKTDQQDRIAQGVKSGQLTAGETSKLEKQEAGINKEERGMRAQDNGKLTKQDRKTLHQQQNQESRRIYRDKHNNKVR